MSSIACGAPDALPVDEPHWEGGVWLQHFDKGRIVRTANGLRAVLERS